MRKHRKIYEEHYGSIPKDWDIHHNDGNKKNNHWSNLEALSKPDHYQRHLEQGDYGAAQAVLIRIDKTHEDISKLARLAQKKRVEEGTHPWLGGKIQSEVQQKRIANGTHNFLGPETNRKRLEDGTHQFLKLDKTWHQKHMHKQIKNNTWPLTAELQKQRLADGTHNFIKMAATIHTCPKCGKVGKGSPMFRWHFDKCRKDSI